MESTIIAEADSPGYTILILTLPGSERLLPLVSRLEAAGLAYRILEGVDGRKGLPSDSEKQIDRDAAYRRLHREMGEAEFACAISHLAAVRHIIDSNLPGAIILEDDAILSDDFLHLVNEGYAERAPMMVFYHRKGRVFRAQKTALFKHYFTAKVAINPEGAVAYAMNRETAEKYYSRCIPITHPADWGCELRELGAVLVTPCLVGHPEEHENHSFIEASRRESLVRSGGFYRGSPMTKFWKLFLPAYWRQRWIKCVSTKDFER